jgi:hypothetical protein
MEVFATPGRHHTPTPKMSTCRATQRRLNNAEARRATALDWTKPVDLSRFARRILAQRSPLLGRRPVPPSCLVHLKIARDAPCLLGFAI